MMRLIVWLSVYLHVVSASFDYIYDERSLLGESTCMRGVQLCHR